MGNSVKGKAIIAICVGVTGIKDVKIMNVTREEAIKEATSLINSNEVVTLAHHYGLFCGKALYEARVYFHNGTSKYALVDIITRTERTY